MLAPHISVVNLGCRVNRVESDRITADLMRLGFAIVEPQDADLIVINTCAVTGEAEAKTRKAVRHALAHPNEPYVVVTGCVVNLHPEELSELSDRVIAEPSKIDVAERVCEVLGVESDSVPACSDGEVVDALGRSRLGVKIQDGCNHRCTYCIVPYVRGREKSRPFEEIVDEVTGLVHLGVREITLLGQNVNSYGRDLFGKPRFADLLRAVGDTGVERIFFTSSHPKDLLPETIDAMAETPAVMPQLHLAVQSGSTRILKEMNRRYTREDYLGLVDRIRNRMPDIALSTDIIVGFPGETEEDFEQTLSLAETVRYAQAYTFIYSKRAGTPAAEIDDPTPHEVILGRFNRLVKVIETTAHEYNQGELHTVVPALIEGTSKKNDAVLLGKSPKNQTVHAPIPEGYSIDQLVGKIVDVDVDVAKTWYLSGSVVGEPR